MIFVNGILGTHPLQRHMPAFCEANLVASSVGDTMARDWGYWTGHFTGGMGWELFFG